MESGDCSGTKLVDSDIWAKLVSCDSRYSDVEIRSNEMVICSEVTCSSLSKLEWCKITKNLEQNSATVQNLSSNAIIVDETLLGKDEAMTIECGSEIISGPDRKDYLSYNFDIMRTREHCTKQLKIPLDVEHAKCSICLNIWHDVVTVVPCLHNFCNGCFSEWLRRSQEKQQSVCCPQCRAITHSVGRNHFLHNIEEVILQTDPSLKRSDEDLAILDAYGSIKSNLVVRTGKNPSRKRPLSPSSDESYEPELPCPQCGIEIGGFKCNWNTVHLQCHGCGGMMPSRADVGVPQHCLGCDRAFCGAYWRAQNMSASDLSTFCSHETFKQISERTVSRIPGSVHQNNRHEKNITERCIQQMGKTLQDIISEWIVKFNNREID